MKKLIVLATLLAVTASQAAVVMWAGDGGGFSGTSDYMDGNGWTDNWGTPYGSAPLNTDSHGLIASTVSPTLWPTVSSAVPAGNVPQTLGVGWDSSYGELNIADGGSLVAGHVYLGFAANVASAGTLNITGGYMVANLHVGYAAFGGTGTVNQSGGVLHLSAIDFVNGVINLSDNAYFLVNGDITGANPIGNGMIVAPVAGQSVVEFYNATDGRTEYTVIPEPATLGLFAVFGGAALFIRKKFMI